MARDVLSLRTTHGHSGAATSGAPAPPLETLARLQPLDPSAA